MPAVKSSVIRFFRYDPRERALHITFTSGKTYIYLDVPPKVYDAFLKADPRASSSTKRSAISTASPRSEGCFPQASIIRAKSA